MHFPPVKHTILYKMSQINNNESYNNIMPISVRNRDKKSHSVTYLKQADKRNKKIANAINGLPEVLQVKLARIGLTTSQPRVAKEGQDRPELAKKHIKKKTVCNNSLIYDYEQDILAEDDAIAAVVQVEEEYAKLEKMECLWCKKMHIEDDMSGNLCVQCDRDVYVLNEEYWRTAYPSDEEDSNLPVYYPVLGNEHIDWLQQPQWCYDEVPVLQQEVAEVEEDDKESIDEEAFITHGRNVDGLRRYYEAIRDNPNEVDAEYEFWLTFEIIQFEGGCREIEDVQMRMSRDNDDRDADERLQDYLEKEREEEMADARAEMFEYLHDDE
jgi:hypothetical protein